MLISAAHEEASRTLRECTSLLRWEPVRKLGIRNESAEAGRKL